MRRVIPLTIAALLLLASLCAAQYEYGPPPDVREGRWEFSLQTRYVPARTHDGESGSQVSLNDDLGFGVGFSYHVSRSFDLGLFFGWRTVGYEATIVSESGQDVERYGSALDVSTFAGDLGVGVFGPNPK